MTTRTLLAALGLSLIAAACGVTREADLAVRTPTETIDEDDVDTSAGSPSDATTPTVPSTTSIPPTTAPAGDVAATVSFAEGAPVELLHGELNDIVVPTRDNQEFIDLVYRGQVPPGFEAVVLSQRILAAAIDNELEVEAASVSDEDTEEATGILFEQLGGLLLGAPDAEAESQRLLDDVPYLQFIVGLQARQIALSDHLAETAGEGEGNPCVRHILVETEAEGQTIQDDLAAGADFGDLAVERSTGPSGPTGGDLGCAPSANYVAEFAEAVDGAALGEFVGPIETQFGWHVLVVDDYEVDGDQLAQDRLSTGLADAVIDVDERVGAWDTARLTIVPTT